MTLAEDKWFVAYLLQWYLSTVRIAPLCVAHCFQNNYMELKTRKLKKQDEQTRRQTRRQTKKHWFCINKSFIFATQYTACSSVRKTATKKQSCPQQKDDERNFCEQGTAKINSYTDYGIERRRIDYFQQNICGITH